MPKLCVLCRIFVATSERGDYRGVNTEVVNEHT